jgi:zinc D-Ala-D-Ala carboxypeptidase
MILTKTFDLKTMTHSDTAVKHGIPNVPNAEQIENLKKLYDNVLLPLVENMPGQINVTVAYRCSKLNAMLKSKPTSQHTMGKAADIEYRENGVEMNQKIIDKIRELDLPVDQCINERNGAWYHVSYNEGKNRKQFFSL